MRILLALVALSIAADLSAQPALVVGAGIAKPAGDLGEQRSVGPLVRIGLLTAREPDRLHGRFDVELAQMPGRNPANPSNGSDLTSIGVFANLIVTGRSENAPYLLFGAGMQQLKAEGNPNPYGMTGGVRAGIGMRLRLGRWHSLIEAVAHGNLTDYASSDFSPGHFFPVSLSLRF